MEDNDEGSAPADAAPEAAQPESSGRNAPSTKAKGARKRTKTGCLTCRRRRIKCGEEKPICKNCIKSRRDCEGYGQRVVFRQPVGPVPPGGPIMPASNAPIAMDPSFAPGQHAYPIYPGDVAGRPPSLLPAGSQPQVYDGAQANFIQNYSAPSASHVGTRSGYVQPGDGLQHPPLQEQSHGNDTPTLAGHAQHDFVSPDAARYGNVSPVVGQDIYHPFGGSIQHQYQVAISEQDDDLYDVETDDDIDMQVVDMVNVPVRSKPWIMTVPGGSSEQEAEQAATFVSYNNLLAYYRPSPFASPLLEPESAQIFSHFVTSAGPAISIFERCPANRSLMGPGSSSLPGYQNLFTYVLPCKALEHQALLHAMLAISSFHLARMTGQTPTASYRHYHYALRRVRKAVGLPQRRRQVETFAATLMLGYYEVLDAEHSKWSNHIVGGSKLIHEFNFAGMTQRVRRMRARVKEQQAYLQSQGLWSDVPGANQGWGYIDDTFSRAEAGVDEGLVSVLMGRPVNYDDFRHVPDKFDDSQADQPLSEHDMYEFRIRCDLYWWYCKQDLYQSLVSGSQLLVPYNRWGKCPPRAGVGDLNAVYGTADHLMLLMARVAEFAAKDRKRKIKVMEANDGDWRPRAAPSAGTAGSQTGEAGSQSQNDNSSVSQPTQKATSPPMYGMAPAAPVRVPEGFAQSPPSSGSPQSQSEPLENQQEVDSASTKAESEWNDMLAASQELAQAFGDGFQPLPADVVPTIPTPFGPALQYRTHSIAIIWAYYYTLLIMLQRVHPSMPPASMIAAGVAAPHTAEYAQLIGRIVGGIHTPSPTPKTRHAPPSIDVNEVSSTFCGVLGETQISTFYAGVQYRASDQREWLVSLMRDIEHLTGLRSAAAIGWGCETAWIKAHEAGAGPEYVRHVEPEYVERKYGVVHVDGMEKRWVTVPKEETIRVGTRLLTV